MTREGDAQEDREEHDDWDDIDEDPPAPAPSHPPTAADDVDDTPSSSSSTRSSSPPRKRRRETSITDFEGHKPQKGCHRRRRLKRKEIIAQGGRVPRASVSLPHVASSTPIPTQLDAVDLPSAHGAYAGRLEDKKTEKVGAKKARSLTELIAKGFRILHWDGKYVPHLSLHPFGLTAPRTTHPLVDINGRIFAVLVSPPSKNDYMGSVGAAYNAIRQEGAAAGFPTSMLKHRRGLFAAMNVGLTYGKGCSFPTWLDNGKYNGLTERLLADEHIQRMAKFADSTSASVVALLACSFPHFLRFFCFMGAPPIRTLPRQQ